jgi:hypothetical protein
VKRLFGCCLFLFSFAASASDCLLTISFERTGQTVAASASGSSEPTDECKTLISAVTGDVIADVGGTKIPLKVKSATVFLGPPKIIFESFTLPAGEEQTTFRALRQVSTVKLSGAGLDEDVDLILSGAGTYRQQQFAIGPATRRPAGDDDAGDDDESQDGATQAMRIKYDYLHEFRAAATRGIVGRVDINVDTTDEGDDFIDDNRLSLSGGYGGIYFGDFVADGLVGTRARYTRAFHSGDEEIDVGVSFSGGVPLVQALNLADTRFAAPPLQLDLNYGWRRTRVDDSSVSRPVFEGTMAYNIFLLRDYWLAASATVTVDDADDRPADTRRTRRLYRVAISQYNQKDQKLTLMTSFEDGSARVISDKVRQYFIGLGWSWTR